MINFESFKLDNGLRVIVHKDTSTPIVAVNVLYNVGAKDEDENKTGFAHLFEHLMFGGSENIPVYDEPLEKIGGDNNAFTNNDITNYYLSLPLKNIETAFWLESDRMLSLDFSQKNLDIQKNVVIEEYKQRYLNQPYGDVWLLLRPLAYKVHPYKWATIGKDISHIENATLNDVKSFFLNYYRPNNAILSVAGNVSGDTVRNLTEKWFGSIESRKIARNNIPPEPVQKEKQLLVKRGNVPFDVIYKAYHMCSRTDPQYYATDLLSDVLSNGKSSRLYTSLVKEKKLFSEINAYITGDLHKGLFLISGNLIKGVALEYAEMAIEEEITKLQQVLIHDDELQKVKNKVDALIRFSNLRVVDKALNLAFSELMGNAGLINKELSNYLNVSKEQIRKQAQAVLSVNNCSTLYYKAN
ncbi:M16 family metallopeptidase [Bacteroidota bacterium]